VPSSGLRPAYALGASEQLRRSRRVAAELARRVPYLADDVDRLLERLAQSHARTAGRPLRPIHGAPHVHQWLEAEDGLGLVDFDRFARGEPELDVATFLAEMDFERGETVGAVKEAFVDGYEEVAGRLDEVVLRAYRCHKRLAKALRTARALRADGDERAQRHLASAVDCLEDRR
jgi:aminoglycoside phosphotransferase (APT) family kinase protein